MQLSVNTFLTLDGVMQGPGAAEEDTSGGFECGGWLVPLADEDMGRIVDGWFAQADAILLGRTTYKLMYPYWSQVTDPANTVATALNSLPKHVVSRSMSQAEAGWQNTTVIDEDVLERIQRLKERPGRELQVHGSWLVARAVHEGGLVDVYRLLIFPVVVGMGKRLFDERSTPSGFLVDSCESTSRGAVHLTLRRSDFRSGSFVVEGGKESVA